MSAVSIVTGMALVLVSAVAEPAGAAPGTADLAVRAGHEVHAAVGVPYLQTVTVTNEGGAPATGSDLVIEINGRDVGPGGTTLITASLGCTFHTLDEFGTTGVECPLGTLAPGASTSRTVTLSATTPGTYLHSASASTTSAETNLDNNNATASAVVGTAITDSLLGLVSTLLLAILGRLHL